MAKQARAGLGLWDRLVLLVAWVVTCGLVYLLGIYVGKGMQERMLGNEDRVVRLPVTTAPPREAESSKGQKELTFYDTLVRDGGAARPPRSGEATSRDATPAAATPPKPATPPATLASVATRPTPPAAMPPIAVRTPPPVIPTPARSLPSPQAVPTATAGHERESAVSVPPPPIPAPAVDAPVARPGTGNWTVLANPTRSHEEADGLARQLRGRGYAASVVRVLREGDTWYRVAVGRFASSEQATEMMQRLREREGVAHVFVAAE